MSSREGVRVEEENKKGEDGQIVKIEGGIGKRTRREVEYEKNE